VGKVDAAHGDRPGARPSCEGRDIPARGAGASDSAARRHAEAVAARGSPQENNPALQRWVSFFRKSQSPAGTKANQFVRREIHAPDVLSSLTGLAPAGRTNTQR